MTKLREAAIRMAIDFHTHIFPEKIVARTISFLEQQCGEKAHLSGTYESLLESMGSVKYYLVFLCLNLS